MQEHINFQIRNDLNISNKKEKFYWNKEDELSSNLEKIEQSESKCTMDNVKSVFPTNIETQELKDSISENNENTHLLRKRIRKKCLRKKYFIIIKGKKYRDIKIFGRLPKYLLENRKHNKFSDDNIIIKIKTYFFNNFLPNIVNKNVKNKTYFIKKITNDCISKIGAQTNLKLLDTVYADFLKKENISIKYSNYLPDENEKILNRILKENAQIEVIKLLNLKIGELFEIFRRKLFENEENITYDLRQKLKGLDILDNNNNNKYEDFDYFINNLKEKGELSKEKFSEYQNKLKKFCINYEKWFKERAKNKNKKVIDIF